MAQIDRAALTGTVTDPAGAVVPSAKVTVVSVESGVSQEGTTNSDGVYDVPALLVGQYDVTVSHEGFNTARFEKITLYVGKTRTLDVRLSVGSVKTQVEVQSAAPALERTSASLSGVITKTELQDLPNNGRNWTTLLIMAPGAIDDGGGDQRTIRFAGRGRDDNNYTMDGVDATGIQEMAQKSSTHLQVSQDAVEEYDVDSALYTAEHGYGAGGQVDIVTRRGGNQFHGDAYEYFRNSALDSRSFIDPAPIPPFHYNAFGASLGGPIVKDKTFFFFNYEGVRQSRGTSLLGLVPSLPFRQTVKTTSPQMAPLIDAYPVGSISVGPDTDEYLHGGFSAVTEDSWLGRVDHTFTNNTSLYVRATRDVNFTDAPLGNLNDRQQLRINPANYVIALQHTFSPAILNVAQFGINRSPYLNPQATVFHLRVLTDSFDSLENDNTDHEIGTTFGWIDTLTIQRGRNTFKMGGEFRRIRLNQGITADPQIRFTDDTSLQLDHLSDFSERGNWCCLGYRRFLVMPYFQDEWKVRPNLTLNTGLRWEYYSVMKEAKGRTRVFDLVRCQGICPPGSPTEFPNYRNFDPRFSLAWSPSRFNNKTVIRTGFGIYHGPGQNDDANAAFESNNLQTTLSSATLPTLAYPVTPAELALASVVGRAPRALQRDRRDLYAEEWGLYVQQALPNDFTLQTAYIGTAGIRLFARTYENVCITAPSSALGCTRPLPTFGPVDLKRNDGNSTFNALQVSLQRRLTRGWLWQSSYLWSHSINDGSVGGGEANAPENVNCRRCDRGPSIFDITHNFVTSSLYDLPIGPGQRYWNGPGLAGKILSGWRLMGTAIAHTGHPLTVVDGRDSSVLPDGNDKSDQRPDRVPGVSVYPSNRTVNNWINPNAFADPALNTFGNAGRGLVRAPGVWQIDVGLQKTSKITERLSVEFRVEAFNLFNKDQFGDPGNLDITSVTRNAQGVVTDLGGFGLVSGVANFNNNNDNFAPTNTGTGTPRQIEFVMRFTF